MKTKILAILLVAVMIISTLSGCRVLSFENENLLSPPKLSGDMLPIERALQKSIKGEYTLKYPKSGEYRSAIILEDITGDGRFEAIAFYSTTDGEVTSVHINIIANLIKDKKSKGDNWQSISSISIVAGDIGSVEFCDFDNDGALEIVVGWEIYGSADRQVAVYALNKKVLSQKLLEPYTTFKCLDLNEDERQEIFIQYLNTATLSNVASVYSVGDQTEKIGSCFMDSTVKTVSKPIASKLSSGQTALYIDEVKGAGAITEVLYYSKGELVNPLLNNKEALENTLTLRPATLITRDINSDGTLEIPVSSELPSTNPSSPEKLYYTAWCSFNGETLASKLVAAHNTIDGYYISVPEKWIGKIAVLKDSENRIRAFFEYDEEAGAIGKPLAYIKTMKIKEYKDSDYKKSDYREIGKSDTLIYLGLALKTDSPLAVTIEELNGMFKLFNLEGE